MVSDAARTASTFVSSSKSPPKPSPRRRYPPSRAPARSTRTAPRPPSPSWDSARKNPTRPISKLWGRRFRLPDRIIRNREARRKPERRASSHLAHHPDLAPHVLREFFRNREAEPGSVRPPIRHLFITLEKPFLLFFRNSKTRVRDAESQHRAAR